VGENLIALAIGGCVCKKIIVPTVLFDVLGYILGDFRMSMGDFFSAQIVSTCFES
jgi:hypothetical protein